MSVEANDHGIKLTGVIDFDSAPELLKQIKTFSLKWSTMDVDLSGVNSANSAAIALFLELVRINQRENKQVQFVNTPKEILRLIEVSNLEGILRAS